MPPSKIPWNHPGLLWLSPHQLDSIVSPIYPVFHSICWFPAQIEFMMSWLNHQFSQCFHVSKPQFSWADHRMVNILGQGETPEMVAKTMAPLRRALRVPDAGIHWYGKDQGDFVHRTCLVGDLEHDFYDVPYIGNVIIPTDELIFFRGVAIPPTRCGFVTGVWWNFDGRSREKPVFCKALRELYLGPVENIVISLELCKHQQFLNMELTCVFTDLMGKQVWTMMKHAYLTIKHVDLWDFVPVKIMEKYGTST